jgi:hypothetical protein
VITYTFKCRICGRVEDVLASISHYSSPEFRPPQCPEHPPMERFFTAADPTRALDLLTSDDHYVGLKASDGTDISSRAKHREYMRAHNVTTVDDFTETWKREAREREATRQGIDPTRAHDIAQAVHKLGG